MTEASRPLFVIPAGEVTIVLDDGPFAGGEIEVRTNVPMGVLRDVRSAWSEYRDAEAGSDDAFAAQARLFALFAEEALVSWNLADHKGSIPADEAGLSRLPGPVWWTILGTWRRSVGTVPLPLPVPSTRTERPSAAGEPSADSATPTGSG